MNEMVCIGSYDNLFCIKPWQRFAKLLLLCKEPSKKKKIKKNDFLNDVESKVSGLSMFSAQCFASNWQLSFLILRKEENGFICYDQIAMKECAVH